MDSAAFRFRLISCHNRLLAGLIFDMDDTFTLRLMRTIRSE